MNKCLTINNDKNYKQNKNTLQGEYVKYLAGILTTCKICLYVSLCI